MARKKVENKYLNDYNEIVAEFGIENLSKKQQADFLIDAGVSLFHSIGYSADSIKIDGLKLAANALGRPLRKNRWQEMIGDGVAYRTKKLKEKALQKIDEHIMEQSYDNILRNNIRKSFETDNTLKVPTSEIPLHVVTDIDLMFRENEDLNTIYKKCVETRKYINEKLWKDRFFKYAKAFQHIYEYKVTYATYKYLVDDRYWEGDGGKVDQYGNESNDGIGRTERKIKQFAEFIRSFAVTGRMDYLTKYLDQFNISVTYNGGDMMPEEEKNQENYLDVVSSESMCKLEGLYDMVVNPFGGY